MEVLDFPAVNVGGVLQDQCRMGKVWDVVCRRLVVIGRICWDAMGFSVASGKTRKFVQVLFQTTKALQTIVVRYKARNEMV